MNRLDFMTYVQEIYRPLENVLLSLVTHRKDVLRREKAGKKIYEIKEKYWWKLYLDCCEKQR